MLSSGGEYTHSPRTPGKAEITAPETFDILLTPTSCIHSPDVWLEGKLHQAGAAIYTTRDLRSCYTMISATVYEIQPGILTYLSIFPYHKFRACADYLPPWFGSKQSCTCVNYTIHTRKYFPDNEDFPPPAKVEAMDANPLQDDSTARTAHVSVVVSVCPAASVVTRLLASFAVLSSSHGSSIVQYCKTYVGRRNL